MKKFIKLEDNEDGTVALSMSLDGVEINEGVITMSLDDLLISFVEAGGIEPSAAVMGENMVAIPSDAETAL